MEKTKRIQIFLILAVAVLTLYNVLPTVFYYTKPLKERIDAPRASAISAEILTRVNDLETESQDWLSSFCKLLHIKPKAIQYDPDSPQVFTITFKDAKDLARFKHFLPRAGALVSFAPAQLSIQETSEPNDSYQVTVLRNLPVHFDLEKKEDYLQFSEKWDSSGNPTPLYQALLFDRAALFVAAAAGENQDSLLIDASLSNAINPETKEAALSLAQRIVKFAHTFQSQSSCLQKYFASLGLNLGENKGEKLSELQGAFQTFKDEFKLERIKLETKEKELRAAGNFLDTFEQSQKETLIKYEATFADALDLLKKNSKTILAAQTPISAAKALGMFLEQAGENPNQYVINIASRNPFIEKIILDVREEKLVVELQKDFKESLLTEKRRAQAKDQKNQLLFDEIAFLARASGEELAPVAQGYAVSLTTLADSSSFLALSLKSIGEAEAQALQKNLQENWHPSHPDLICTSMPIVLEADYQSLGEYQKGLSILIGSPANLPSQLTKGLNKGSLYVIVQGAQRALQKLQLDPSQKDAQEFLADFKTLQQILAKQGFIGYSAASVPGYKNSSDFIFEKEGYYYTTIKATRENFETHGSKKFALLELSNVEQRILTKNKIEDQIHEDLLKWRDEYAAAQIGTKGLHKFDIPKPTKNPLLSNFVLSFKKYFAGDDRKIIKWGLDLSGGKTVQIELRDSTNKIVTDPADIKQAISELHSRVNKMGVSEISIRQEGNSITLDFPGSQGLSAKELIKASSMSFHIVNEKLSLHNPAIGKEVNQFLQEVWNEAVITNQKEPEDLQRIAWEHIHGDSFDPDHIAPRSESAKAVHEYGLRLSSPIDSTASSNFNDVISKIAVFAGENFSDWEGQTHPLLIVFENYALEGSSLENVYSSYDPTRGNFLSFGVKSSFKTKDGQKISPSNDLLRWTSEFAKEKIQGTDRAQYTQGRGYRMAVLLNNKVISSPALDSPLSDKAMITGSFSQNQINRLEADLKAGSLTFTPKILSEKNVSPELGKAEKASAIGAMVTSFVLIALMMIGYYRFAGIVAACAVLFNLLIMWGALQNLSAALTLAGIAGIILSVGMAVDANVLVYERIREEFAQGTRLGASIQAGYEKAFSAILDSNVTTIIAALVLLQFESGPIKAFAITLIIGVISSMFTSLYVTKTYFQHWVKNPAHKQLNMLQLFKVPSFNFLKYKKVAIQTALALLIGGAFALYVKKNSLFGMDFTGGFAITLPIENQAGVSAQESVEKALIASGLSKQDFSVRELSGSNVRIFLSSNFEQKVSSVSPTLQDTATPITYSYQENPMIVALLDALSTQGVAIAPESFANLDQNWTAVSGQLSSHMKWQAILGVLIASVCVLLYIAVRFEFKYAISATLCMVHDAVITLAVIALLALMKLPLQIDLHIIAALLTIVGYSLNDTIIVFDRIREDAKAMRKQSFAVIVNHALNVTLSRTIITSGTTFVVLLPLIIFGGSTLFGFSLVMAIGIIIGTLSSLFIATPLLMYFHEKEQQKAHKITIESNPRDNSRFERV